MWRLVYETETHFQGSSGAEAGVEEVLRKRGLTLQKKILRAIVNQSYDSHTRHVYLQYNIVPVNRLFDYTFACWYKKITARNDHFLSSVVSLTCCQSSYDVRKPYHFCYRIAELIMAFLC